MNVLAIGAHPDDVEFGCGGTLAKHVAGGDSVNIVVMSSSTVLDAYTRDIMRKAEQSTAEANRAAEVLGIAPIIGPFQDTKIPFDGESVSFLEKVIRKYSIDLIYTHWPGDSNQDHIASLNNTLAAGRLVKNVLCYEQVPMARVAYKTYNINYYVDITQHWDLKKRACNEHVSQIIKYKERGFDLIKQLEYQARYRGSQAEVDFAEGFHVLKLTR